MEVRGFLNDSALKGLSCFAAQMHISGSPQKGAGGELSQHPSPWATLDHLTWLSRSP